MHSRDECEHEAAVRRLGKASNVVCHLVRDAECGAYRSLTLFVDATCRPVSGVVLAHCDDERVSDEVPVYVTLHVIKTGILLATNTTRALDKLRAHLAARQTRHALPTMALEHTTLLRIDVDLHALSSSSSQPSRIELCRANEVIVGVCSLSLLVYARPQATTAAVPAMSRLPPLRTQQSQEQQDQQQQRQSSVSRRLSFDAAPMTREHARRSASPTLPSLATSAKQQRQQQQQQQQQHVYDLCATATPHPDDATTTTATLTTAQGTLVVDAHDRRDVRLVYTPPPSHDPHGGNKAKGVDDAATATATAAPLACVFVADVVVCDDVTVQLRITVHGGNDALHTTTTTTISSNSDTHGVSLSLLPRVRSLRSCSRRSGAAAAVAGRGSNTSKAVARLRAVTRSSLRRNEAADSSVHTDKDDDVSAAPLVVHLHLDVCGADGRVRTPRVLASCTQLTLAPYTVDCTAVQQQQQQQPCDEGTPTRNTSTAHNGICEDDVYALVAEVLSRSAGAQLERIDLGYVRACVQARYAAHSNDNDDDDDDRENNNNRGNGSRHGVTQASRANACDDELQHCVWAAARQYILTTLLHA